MHGDSGSDLRDRDSIGYSPPKPSRLRVPRQGRSTASRLTPSTRRPVMPSAQLCRVVHLLGSPHRQGNRCDLTSNGDLGEVRFRPSVEQLLIVPVQRIFLPCPTDHRRGRTLEDPFQRAVVIAIETPCLLHGHSHPASSPGPDPIRRTAHDDCHAGIRPEGPLARDRGVRALDGIRGGE